MSEKNPFLLVYDRTAGSAERYGRTGPNRFGPVRFGFFGRTGRTSFLKKIIKKAVLTEQRNREQSIAQLLRIIAWRLFC